MSQITLDILAVRLHVLHMEVLSQVHVLALNWLFEYDIIFNNKKKDVVDLQWIHFTESSESPQRTILKWILQKSRKSMLFSYHCVLFLGKQHHVVQVVGSWPVGKKKLTDGDNSGNIEYLWIGKDFLPCVHKRIIMKIL